MINLVSVCVCVCVDMCVVCLLKQDRGRMCLFMCASLYVSVMFLSAPATSIASLL